MKVQAFGIVCLLGSALAAPFEQAQNAQEVQSHQMGAAAAPAAFTLEDIDANSMMAGHHQMQRPNNNMPTGIDMDAFEQMVAQVQKQVAAIEQLVQTQGADPKALLNALVTPMTELNQTLAMGVSRLALPDLGGILGGVIGGGGAAKKAKPLGLLSELLRSVSNLLEGLLTKGPIGNLLNDLLGGILGGVTGTVGGVLGGGAASQVPDLLEGILNSVGTVAGGAVGGVPVALP
ncbi:predicted protein [Chaetomium globosum CBS 148.51]|uniref:Uncharacterized protein n=1 Tax=Chaetomium globosum (strain ATCC 6205 / CBS 148.51 / DSM 1962 / NBRC 6347 / NRRL 1970) TaxID=306901 RepID=Q2HFT1_CHAGB|nr:uncharacterized protein CHGG_00923 [Chaetomium globosum CBS 148.51]EAQ92688.1 predicted protein [Chaetomium globosum CBS 148.51]